VRREVIDVAMSLDVWLVDLPNCSKLNSPRSGAFADLIVVTISNIVLVLKREYYLVCDWTLNMMCLALWYGQPVILLVALASLAILLLNLSTNIAKARLAM
jgi:hypothetical protein